jgi:hypothetical protein
LVSCSDDDVSVVLDNASNTVATIPLARDVALEPDSVQVDEPVLLLQERDLFAAVASGPAVTAADEKSSVE